MNYKISKKILFILFFLTGVNSYPQIQLENLLELNEFSVPSGYDNFLIFNKEAKGNPLFILWGKPDKSITISNSGSFKKSSFKYEINKIAELTVKRKSSSLIAFVSRKSRTAGVISIKKDLTLKLEKDITLESYPDNICSGDIDRDGDFELLVNGSAFSGISIIKYNDSKLTETKIERNSSFSEAVFVDLNNDGYKDIAAYNIFTSSIEFFYNNTSGAFYKARSIVCKTPAKLLKSGRYNKDGYDDIVFMQNNDLKIIYGDRVSAYDKILNIYPKDKISGYEITDINNDGSADILYYNYNKSVLTVIACKPGTQIYDEVTVYKLPYLSSISLDKKGEQIFMLSTNGKVRSLIPIKTGNASNFAAGVEPFLINGFDLYNDKVVDIFYIDKYDNTIRFVISGKNGKPVKFYSYPLISKPEEIIVDDKNSKVKTFYCFKPNEKLIEVIKADFGKNSFSRITLYAPGKIKTLSASLKGKLHVLYSNNEQLLSCLMPLKESGKPSDVRVVSSSYEFSPYAIGDTAYYWKKNSGSYLLYKWHSNKNELVYESTCKIQSISSLTGIYSPSYLITGDSSVFIQKDSTGKFYSLSAPLLKTKCSFTLQAGDDNAYLICYQDKKNELSVYRVTETEIKPIKVFNNVNATSLFAGSRGGIKQVIFTNNLLNCISTLKIE